MGWAPTMEGAVQLWDAGLADRHAAESGSGFFSFSRALFFAMTRSSATPINRRGALALVLAAVGGRALIEGLSGASANAGEVEMAHACKMTRMA